jgi:hypothetical protein
MPDAAIRMNCSTEPGAAAGRARRSPTKRAAVIPDRRLTLDRPSNDLGRLHEGSCNNQTLDDVSFFVGGVEPWCHIAKSWQTYRRIK